MRSHTRPKKHEVLPHDPHASEKHPRTQDKEGWSLAQRKGGAAPSLAKQAAAKVNGQLPASTLAHITRAHDAKRTKMDPETAKAHQDRTERQAREREDQLPGLSRNTTRFNERYTPASCAYTHAMWKGKDNTKSRSTVTREVTGRCSQFTT